jgi:hypothetical protein
MCKQACPVEHTYAIILVFKNTNNFIQRMLKCMRVIFRLPKLLLKRLDEKDESETSPAKDTKKKAPSNFVIPKYESFGMD